MPCRGVGEEFYNKEQEREELDLEKKGKAREGEDGGRFSLKVDHLHFEKRKKEIFHINIKSVLIFSMEKIFFHIKVFFL